MPDIKDTTRAQTKFLRAFLKEPFGPGVEDWPTAAVLRRWLRKPGFVVAMKRVREAIRYQADFQLLSAAGAASHHLHTTLTGGDLEGRRQEVQAMSALLKLSHLRERFAPPEPKSMPRDGELMSMLRGFHRDATVGDVLDWVDSNSDAEPQEEQAA
jgi:hypothetical protein